MPYELAEWMRHDLLRNNLLTSHHLSRKYLVPHHLEDDGAFGINRLFSQRHPGARLYIEQQRFGSELLQSALLGPCPQHLDDGIRIITWGLEQQAVGGGYPHSGDAFHSSEIFLEALARACLVWKEAAHEEIPSGWMEGLHRIATWIIGADVLSGGLRINAPFTHRLWILAAALESSARVCEDRTFSEKASSLVRKAVLAQGPNGINPERGGFDANYQSAGLLFAARYLAASQDEKLRSMTRAVISRGLDPLILREDGRGNISIMDSTRAGREAHRTGKLKGVNYWEGLQTFVFGAIITSRDDVATIAERIARRSGGISPEELF